MIAKIDKNTFQSSDSDKRDISSKLRNVVGRLFCMGILVKAFKFLLFREEHPKHRVIQSASLIITLLVLVTPMTLLLSYLLLLLFAAYGFVGFVVGYIALIVVAAEVPHCILEL